MAGYILKLRDDTSRVTFYVARYGFFLCCAVSDIMSLGGPGVHPTPHHGATSDAASDACQGSEVRRWPLPRSHPRRASSPLSHDVPFAAPRRPRNPAQAPE